MEERKRERKCVWAGFVDSDVLCVSAVLFFFFLFSISFSHHFLSWELRHQTTLVLTFPCATIAAGSIYLALLLLIETCIPLGITEDRTQAMDSWHHVQDRLEACAGLFRSPEGQHDTMTQGIPLDLSTVLQMAYTMIDWYSCLLSKRPELDSVSGQLAKSEQRGKPPPPSSSSSSLPPRSQHRLPFQDEAVASWAWDPPPLLIYWTSHQMAYRLPSDQTIRGALAAGLDYAKSAVQRWEMQLHLIFFEGTAASQTAPASSLGPTDSQTQQQPSIPTREAQRPAPTEPALSPSLLPPPGPPDESATSATLKDAPFPSPRLPPSPAHIPIRPSPNSDRTEDQPPSRKRPRRTEAAEVRAKGREKRGEMMARFSHEVEERLVGNRHYIRPESRYLGPCPRDRPQAIRWWFQGLPGP